MKKSEMNRIYGTSSSDTTILWAVVKRLNEEVEQLKREMKTKASNVRFGPALDGVVEVVNNDD